MILLLNKCCFLGDLQMNRSKRNASRTCRGLDWIARALLVLLVVDVVCGQLGQLVTESASKRPRHRTETEIKENEIQDANSGHKNENEIHEKSSEVMVYDVENTLIACINGSILMDNVTYLNLTQVLQNEHYLWEDSEASACFMFCKTSFPSQFISVQEEFGQSTHSCGCHDEFEGELKDVRQDERMCNSTPGFMRLYCGPTNFDCFNGSGKLKGYTVLVLGILIPLLSSFFT